VKELARVIEELAVTAKHSPQHQLEVVQSISRRGFLKQVLATTLWGASIGLCNHAAHAIGIDGLPDLGDTDRSNLSPTQAALLGKQVILDIYAQGSMLEDYDCLDYLNTLGDSLVSYSPLAGMDFSFYLIKEKTINAFALPGGYICVNNGLIYATLSEAELSSVMSHEIGHVVQHHIFRNLGVQNRAQWLSLAGILAGALLAPINPGAAIVAAQSGQGIGIQNMLSFSRDYEREADRVGQQLMYQAGFDAHAMPTFFGRLQEAYKFNSNDALNFLQTHPVTLERLSEAEARANQLPVKMREDSCDFLLAREKCRIYQLGVKEAIKFYLSALASKRYVSLEAQYFGLSLSYYLTRQFAKSQAILAKITALNFLNNPMIIGLKARLLIAKGDMPLANRLYDNAIADYPNHKGLWMAQLEFLIMQKNYLHADQRLSVLAQQFPEDPDVWDQYAILYADVNANNPLRYHYGLGMELLVLGNFAEAMSQFQLALKAKAKTPSDNNLQDLISAKMAEVGRNLAH
jgi:predicted Zn-dependent protease